MAGEAGARPLRIVFFGSPVFAVPALEALAASRHRVVGVVTQPDRPRGRGRRPAPTPVRARAEALGIPVLAPERPGEPAALAWLRERRPDLGCVVAYGAYIPKSVRDLFPLGMINAHASLLPRHRGASPIQHAILAGDPVTGVTVIRVAREMDAGDWCLRREVPIAPDETAGELAERLAPVAAEALLEAVDAIAAGRAEFRPQPAEGVTLAPKIDRAFGRVAFDRPVEEVARRVRAATPWPGADVRFEPSGLVVRLLRVRPDRGGPPPEPGRVRAEGGRLWIGALDGWLEVLHIQRPGRRAQPAEAFLRGARLAPGERARSALDPAPPPEAREEGA